MSFPIPSPTNSARSLNGRLKAFRQAFEATADPRVVSAFARAQSALESAGIMNEAVKAGQFMPEFTRAGLGGRPLAPTTLLKRGPVVVSFHRGDWCDYCTMELAGMSAAFQDIAGLGASLIAISPQPPDARLRADVLRFPLLVDVDAHVARRCGIAYSVPDEIRPIYTMAGRKPPVGQPDSWLRPLPATYVVDWTGEIALSYVNIDYTSRLEPLDIIACLKMLTRLERRQHPSRPVHERLPTRWHGRPAITHQRSSKRNP
ncbi:peroxiredoxin-like family protein [Mesorhizobium sp. B2-3-5]|uniref:peroxiredoxin-like family protein n=1 Tax=Mesorhizobium sp. B2-3-5 TaxID=2589958 RepID=UPI00112C5C55|nr:peroxiredoxin-like family protein [Mesorhizobium sp. B2-3-5]TPM24604.1 AhpC/TSA family protein [Mesorhizobium sp. B2-3-5]